MNNPDRQHNRENIHNKDKVKTQLNNNQIGGDVNIANTKKDQVKGDKVTINNIKLGGLIGLVGVLVVSIYTIWFVNTNNSPTVKPLDTKQSKIPCMPQQANFRVDVAHFSPQRPSFAIKLVSKIKQKVPLSHKNKVTIEKYNDYFFDKAKPKAEVNKLIAKTCQYKGLVVYGDRNAQAGEKSLICWIDVINLKKQVSHQLEEPPSSFKFSIPHHAHYVSSFVSGLLKYYLNLNNGASQDFQQFLQQIENVPTPEKKQVEAYCKIYLGKIALESGNKAKALKLFKEANQLNPSDFNTKNINKLSKNRLNRISKSTKDKENISQTNQPNTSPLDTVLNHHQEAILPVLQEALKNPKDVVKLDFRNLGLTKIPPQITQLVNIKKLYFTHNKLTTLPNELSQLNKLTYLYCRYNQIKDFPVVLTKMPALKYLYLKGNQLKSIPADIQKMTALTSLHLENNQITHLPAEISQLKKLKWLYLSNNPITQKNKKEITTWLPNCHVVFEAK